MSITIFYVFHVLSVILLCGVTFAAFAAPLPENRRKFLMLSGIASVLTLLGGFGLLGMLKFGWPLWAWMKIACWLAISGIIGQAFRQPEKTKQLTFATAGIIFVALVAVYFKPV